VVFSTTTVSTTRADGLTSFRAGFFAVARLGLAVATVGFVAFALAGFATLRALLRLAELPLRSFPRFCAFDPFLRLAMIAPPWLMSRQSSKDIDQVPATHLTSYQQIALGVVL
jgi:hypothetical protein